MKYKSLDEWKRAALEYEKSNTGGSAADFMYGNQENIQSDLLEAELGEIGRKAYNHALVKREALDPLQADVHLNEWGEIIQGKEEDKGKITASLDSKLRNNRDERNTALSLGMSAVNEANGPLLVEKRPETPLNKEVRQFLTDNIATGLTSKLAGVGLNPAETSVVKGDKDRAVDRLMDLWNGYQPSVGYPFDGVPVAGGHLLSRKWSEDIGVPEQITARYNMEFEGDKDNVTRGEHRGRYAGDLSFRRFLSYLDETNLSEEEKSDIKYAVNNLGTTPDWS